MVTQTTMITTLDPTAAPIIAEGGMAPRLESLNGKTLGLLANGKRNADRLLDHVAALISEHYQIKDIVARTKANPSHPCPDDLMQELVAQCDAVVTAAGD